MDNESSRPYRTATPVPTGGGAALSELLARVCRVVRSHHYSRNTERAYVAWVRRYLLFHGGRHPDGLGAPAIGGFLSSLAAGVRVSASTQNQALSALLFLYRLCSAEHNRGYVVTPAMWRSGRILLSVARQ